MNVFAAITKFVERARADWDGVRLADLVFGEKDTALLLFVAIAGAGLVALVLKSVVTKTPGRGSVVLPAVLGQQLDDGVC